MVLRKVFVILYTMSTHRSYCYIFFATLVVVFSIILNVLPVEAQTSASSVITSNDVAILIEPETPKPNTNVTITLNSYTINLSNHPIQWYINDTLVLSQTGAESYTINSGPLGTRTSIKAIINVTSTGNLLTKSIIISPIDVDLLWEATDSYVPPFYKGKKLPAAQGQITVTAIPITSRSLISDQKNSVYYWNNNYDNNASASGFGRRSYTLQNDIFNKTERIGVTVSSTNGSFTASKSIVIPTVNPKIVFYTRNSSGKTLWNKGSVNAITTNNTGTANIIIEPYYFSVQKPWQLEYVWKTPTQTLTQTNRQNTITMPNRGSTIISVDINHLSAILQSAQSRLTLTY